MWNSGIFIWTADRIIRAFEKYLPDMYQSMEKISEHLNTADEKKHIKKIYPTLKKVSIDVGIMEKHRKVYVIPASFGWSDLGTWTSLYENQDRDKSRNAIVGNLVKLYNSQGNMIHIEGKKAVVIDGLENYIIVDTKDSLLICPLENDQEIKKYVNDLKFSKGEDFV